MSYHGKDNLKKETKMELNEVSKPTLRSYVEKAKDNLDSFSRKKGRKSAVDKATMDKRRAGLERAAAKLQKIRAAEHEEWKKQSHAVNTKLDDHFAKEHPAVLAKHGFEHVHSANGRSTWIHKHDNGHVTMVAINHEPRDPHGFGGGHTVKVSNTKGSSWSAYNPNPGVWDHKDHEKTKNEMMPKFENHIIETKASGANEHPW